ncbi:unnamed protein product [Ectocarpus sp. 12 AP-2014]
MFVRMENWDGLAVIFSRLPSGMPIIRCCLPRDFLPIFSATVSTRTVHSSENVSGVVKIQ